MEEEYDEELEKLLGEIPIATSAPPHVEELQTAYIDHHQNSSEQVSQVDTFSDEASIIQTSRHQPLLYTPYSNSLQTSPLMGTLTCEDARPSSSPLSPLYGGLPASEYNTTTFDKHVNYQSRDPIDLGFTYNSRLSPISSDSVNYLGRVVLGESQIYTQHGKVKNSVSSIDEGIEVGSTLGATQSASEALLSTSYLPPSLQSLDPFAQSGNGCLVKEVHNHLDNLALEDRRLSQSQEMRFVHCVQSPSEVHRAKQLLEQSLAMPEPFETNLTGAMPMHLGHQSSLANGAFLPHPQASFVPSYHSNMRMVYAHQLHGTSPQQQLEERVLCRQQVKEEFLLRQQRLQEQQARFYASLQSQPRLPYSRHQLEMQHSHSIQAPNCVFDVHTSKATLANGVPQERNRSTAEMWGSLAMHSGDGLETSGFCRYFLDGFCSRGDLCPFPHSRMPNNSITTANELLLSEAAATRKGPRSGLFTPTIVIPAVKKKNYLGNGHASSHCLSNGTHLSSPNHLSSMSGGGSWKEIDPAFLHSVNSQQHQQSPPPPKYTTLTEVEGHIYSIAKDQHGCRFLQRKFEEGVPEDVQKIFVEIIDHVVELMTDPFGNYLVQKLLEVCDDTQRMEILHRVSGKDQLVTISLNMHGTRAVQKLIETLSLTDEVSLVVESLKQGVVTLIKDLNGNHVVQRCLQRLSSEDSQFIFDAAASHCVQVATHRHGCCVLQRCVDFSSGQQRNGLVAEIAANALVLSQDPFGNYVVQYILDLGLAWAIEEVISHLDGNFVHLAMQKFSSNVVEKCLKLSGEESKGQIVRELMTSARLAQLLQDPFANYVVQSALMVSKGTLHFGLVEAIRPHLPALRSSPYGKRILSRTNLKK